MAEVLSHYKPVIGSGPARNIKLFITLKSQTILRFFMVDFHIVGGVTLSSAILSDTGLEGDGDGSRFEPIPTRPENSRLDDRESRADDFRTLEHGYRKSSDPSSASESALKKMFHLSVFYSVCDMIH